MARSLPANSNDVVGAAMIKASDLFLEWHLMSSERFGLFPAV